MEAGNFSTKWESGTSGRTRIKVCGITDQHEANEIVRAGVDALGFIFAAQSPRKIEPDKAREIVRQLPPFVDAVGVFVNEDAKVVGEIIQYCRLTMVQLHGEEPPDYCEKVPCRVIKAFRIGPSVASRGQTLYEPYQGKVSAFLLDTFHERMAGGTGKTFDWNLLEQLRPPGPLILSGGLSPENVGAAIAEVRPFAVDANSGVEIEPGRKDIARVNRFVEEVKKADATRATASGG